MSYIFDAKCLNVTSAAHSAVVKRQELPSARMIWCILLVWLRHFGRIHSPSTTWNSLPLEVQSYQFNISLSSTF